MMFQSILFRRPILLLVALLALSKSGAQTDCAFMRVSIAAGGWVACDQAVHQIQVCNEGSQAATAAAVDVTLPPGFVFVSASIPPTTVSGQQVRFFFGAFAAGDCQNFSLTAAVPCNVSPGAAFCLLAKATPGGCPQSAPGWDGSELVLEGACFGSDSVSFKVRNRGINPMSATVEYVITEDHLLKTQGTVPIVPPGDSALVSIQNPTGKTYTFQTMQTPGHPFPQPISLSVEGCGGPPASTGYLMQFPQYNGDVHTDLFCDTIAATAVGGVNKTGFPFGYGAEHFIDAATELRYRIRFQNTGTGTAQSVTLRDTLSEWLDLSSLRPGAASHFYTWSLQNHVLTVVFPAALLPPASVNESASRGFFTFHSGILPDAPLDALVENSALVQLSNGLTGQTDTTRHRLGEHFILLDVPEPATRDAGFVVGIFPNPFRESARLVFSGEKALPPFEVRVYDLAGRALRTLQTDTTEVMLEKMDLPAGVYLFQSQNRMGGVVTGKLVVW